MHETCIYQYDQTCISLARWNSDPPHPWLSLQRPWLSPNPPLSRKLHTMCAQRCGTLWEESVLRGVVPYSTWCAQRCGTLLHLSSFIYPIQLHVSYPAACIQLHVWRSIEWCPELCGCMYRAACIALNTCPELTCPELSGKALCCCCVPLVW